MTDWCPPGGHDELEVMVTIESVVVLMILVGVIPVLTTVRMVVLNMLEQAAQLTRTEWL